MGQNNSIFEPTMKVDRMICNEPHKIQVGFYPKGNEANPYKTQVIRVNDEPLKALVSFVETPNALQYEFEDNVSFKLMKKEDEVVYHIKTNDINYTGVVNEIVRNYWKDIAWNSKELDKIGALFKQEEK
jgi:hypothetical protein